MFYCFTVFCTSSTYSSLFKSKSISDFSNQESFKRYLLSSYLNLHQSLLMTITRTVMLMTTWQCPWWPYDVTSMWRHFNVFTTNEWKHWDGPITHQTACYSMFSLVWWQDDLLPLTAPLVKHLLSVCCDRGVLDWYSTLQCSACDDWSSSFSVLPANMSRKLVYSGNFLGKKPWTK